jgi:hypothetical protein
MKAAKRAGSLTALLAYVSHYPSWTSKRRAVSQTKYEKKKRIT